MRITIAASILLVASANAYGTTRRLAADCNVPSGFTPSEAQPLDLDSCTLLDNDDISSLLIDIGARWGAVYVRAPSKSLSLNSDTIMWEKATSKPIKAFVLLEDQDPNNSLVIHHVPSDATGQLSLSPEPCATTPVGGSATIDKKYVMWGFTNYSYIKLGGPAQSITLIGTHPGLGDGASRMCGTTPAYVQDINAGLLDFRVTDGSRPVLADVRLNTMNSEAYSIYFNGAQGVGASSGRAQQVNIAGLHWNTTGIFVHGGVQSVWFDPDRTVISDPYVRNMGWDGAISGTANGRQVGCFDSSRSRGRQNSGPYYVDRMTGGVTLEYGYISFAPRVVKEVGSSATSPFVVRVKDWGTSGPGTGYPAGVMVKKGWQSILTKGDPHPAYGNNKPFRFIKYVSLPSKYGQGLYGGELSKCASGNSTNNNYPDADDNLIRFEANDNVGENFGWDVSFEGDWNTQWRRGSLIALAWEPWSASDRSYGHVLRALKDMEFKDTIYLHDTNTATGPGLFSNIGIRPECVYAAGGTPCSKGAIAAKANAIQDTNVSGAVTISASSGTTTISNVNFTGSARDVISVGAGSVVAASSLCAPPNSRIVGTGTATYDGASVALPYYLPSANGCETATTTSPEPPQNVTVE